MKISYLIFFGFLLILVLFSITTYINFRQAENVNENSEFFARSTEMVRSSNRFQRNILNMVSGLRGYMFSGEQYFIQSYDSAALENENILAELAAQTRENSIQQNVLEEIHALNDRWLNEFARPLIDAKRMAQTSDSSQASFNKLYREKLLSGTENKIHRALQSRFKDFADYEYNLRETRKVNLDTSIARTREISFYLTTFSIIIGVAIAFFLAYTISSRIMSMVRMADNISAGNYEVHTQESGTDELSRLAHSLNHMAKVLAENINLLKRKNEELDQFAHIVSHDLKAPLRGIDNVINWIEEDHIHELSPKMHDYIQLIRGRIVRAENLIRGILSYARVSREMPEKENVNLNQLLDDIKGNLTMKPGLALDVQQGLPEIFTERLPLQQVLSNLISNAIKYHDKENGKVKVYFKNNDAAYEFFVEDDGPGIEKHYHDKIFGIFQTLQERDSFESTGVGLAIVKKILDDRKQNIHVRSVSGKGSVFEFTWPKN